MAGPEGYKAGYLDKIERNLFQLRDADGTRNSEVSKVIRLMQREFGSQKAFVGVAPFGSSVLGYGIRDKHGNHGNQSDIDFATFYDSSIDPDAEKKLVRIYEQEHDLAMEKGTYTYPAHMPGVYRHDLNIEKIKSVIHEVGFSDLKTQDTVIDALTSLAGLAVGPYVDEYRHRIGDEIKKMPEKSRLNLISYLANWAVEREFTSHEEGHIQSKSQERLYPQAVPERVSQMLQMRAELWRERLIKVYELKKNV